MTLRLIAGLGNPGAEYSRTRHNAGFWFIEALAEHLDVRFGLESKLLAEVAKARVGGENLLLVIGLLIGIVGFRISLAGLLVGLSVPTGFLFG